MQRLAKVLTAESRQLFSRSVFSQKLHFRCLTGSWMRLCKQIDALKFPDKHFTDPVWNVKFGNCDFSKAFYI